jgi:hypothetical protein
MEGSDRGLTEKNYPGTCLEGLGKTMKNLNQDSRSPGRHLNPGPAKYGAGVLTTQSICSVIPSHTSCPQDKLAAARRF